MGEARWFSNSNPTPPGAARQQVTFFCFAKKKVTKEKATPVCRPSGSLDQLQASGAAQLALTGHTKRAPLRSSNSARLNLRSLAVDRGGAQGKKKIEPKIQNQREGQLVALLFPIKNTCA
jgi:hypothetical protein